MLDECWMNLNLNFRCLKVRWMRTRCTSCPSIVCSTRISRRRRNTTTSRSRSRPLFVCRCVIMQILFFCIWVISGGPINEPNVANQVRLPRNQLFVTRVSPRTQLADLLHTICNEKNLDPNKYELRHPGELLTRWNVWICLVLMQFDLMTLR